MSFENIVGKGKMVVISIFPFPTMFSILLSAEIITLVTFDLLPANAFSLFQFMILLFGKQLTFYQTIPDFQ